MDRVTADLNRYLNKQERDERDEALFHDQIEARHQELAEADLDDADALRGVLDQESLALPLASVFRALELVRDAKDSAERCRRKDYLAAECWQLRREVLALLKDDDLLDKARQEVLGGME